MAAALSPLFFFQYALTYLYIEREREITFGGFFFLRVCIGFVDFFFARKERHLPRVWRALPLHRAPAPPPAPTPFLILAPLSSSLHLHASVLPVQIRKRKSEQQKKERKRSRHRKGVMRLGVGRAEGEMDREE